MFNARVGAVAARPSLLVLRQALPLLAVAALFSAYRSEIASVDLAAISTDLARIGWHQWVMAAVATLASFAAIGRYDQVFHGLAGTPISAGQARVSGMAAIAIAQFAGLGLLTATLVRWRMIDHFRFTDAVRFSAGISAAFILALALLASGLVLMTGIGAPAVRHGAAASMALLVCAPLLFVLRPRWLRKLPPLRAMLRVVGLVGVDIGCAALAFWILVPEPLDVPLVAFVAAFFGAFLLGLVGATPGGIGPFEAGLLGLLPLGAPEPVLAAALAFRIVYCLVPSAIGCAWLLSGWSAPAISAGPRQPAPTPAGPARCTRRAWRTAQPDTAFMQQGPLAPLRLGETAVAAARLAQTLVVLREPFEGGLWDRAGLEALQDRATRTGRGALIYKCSARTAALARHAGWSVRHVVSEAWLDPHGFDTAGPERRQLRRMLRKADSAGVEPVDIDPTKHEVALQRVAEDWARRRGGERGFSMGRFEASYVAGQRVFGARLRGELVAFATVNRAGGVWSIDLMRAQTGAPPGTMHRLVVTALTAARQAGADHFSLAGVPILPDATRWPGPLADALNSRIAEPGLVRFKQAFAPGWVPLYAAAPTPVALAVGLVEVLAEIGFPAPITGTKSNLSHDNYDNYEFASRSCA